MEVAKELLDAILSGNVEGVQGGTGEEGGADKDGDEDGGGDGPPARRACFGALARDVFTQNCRRTCAACLSAGCPRGEVMSKDCGRFSGELTGLSHPVYRLTVLLLAS